LLFFVFGGGTLVAPKKISAKELVADIKAKMSDDELAAKYGISVEGLQRLFHQLLDKGLVNESDLSGRPSEPSCEEEVALSVCEPDKEAIVPPLPPPATVTVPSTGNVAVERNPSGLLAKCKVVLGIPWFVLHSLLRHLGTPFRKKPSDTPTGKISPTGDLPAEPAEPLPQPIPSIVEKSIWSTARVVLESVSSALLVALRVGWTGAKAVWNWLRSKRRAPEVVQHPGMDSTPDGVTPGPDSSEQGSIAITREREDLKVESEVSHQNTKAGAFQKVRAVPAAVSGFLMSLLTGQFLLKVFGYLVFVLLFAVSMGVILQRHELNLRVEVESLVRMDPIPKTREIQKEKGVCAAIAYLEHFMDFDYVKNNAEAVELLKNLKEERRSIATRSKDMLKSFWYGAKHDACAEDIVVSTLSDVTGVSSIRTVVEHDILGKEVDEFTVWLARVDGLLTGVTVVGGVVTIVSGAASATPAAPLAIPATVTSGSATAAAGTGKFASVLFKVSHRFGKLTAPFQKHLIVVFKEAHRAKSVEPLTSVIKPFQKLRQVKGVGSKDCLTVISHAKDLKDLEHLTEFANTCGKHTGKFLELTGDKALAIYRQHGHSPVIVEAMNTSIQYGDKGSNLLAKLGPEKFMHVVGLKTSKAVHDLKEKQTLPKTRLHSMLHSAGISRETLTLRGVKSLLTGSLMALLIWTAKFLPQWAIFSMAAVSGLVVIGIPSMGIYRAWRWLRTPA
jgi:hypothetical protein